MTFRSSLAIALALCAAPAAADFSTPQLETVPIARLVDNLEAALKTSPTDTTVRFNLARVHAMAYASKVDATKIVRGKATKGAWFDHTPKHVPFEVKSTTDKAKLEAARRHLKQAIEQYEAVVKAKPDHLTARLGLAWCIEQSGDKPKAIEQYRKLIDDAWQTEKDLKSAGLAWHSVVAEAAGYLMPLLDKTKDQKELATLRDRIAQVGKVNQPITPIAIPLEDGVGFADIVDPAADVLFDADGSGTAKRWTWITKQAGWLVVDRADTRSITSALQLFGGVTFFLFWEDGYQPLAALDDDRDGKVAGTELAGLAIWQDANGDGISGPGEVKPLAAWNIVELTYRGEACAASRFADSCAAEARAGVRFRDGTQRTTYDVILRRR